MSNVIIFAMGCFVSLVVASAVGLLLWGAAGEPGESFLPSRKSDQAAPQPASTPPVSNLESKSLA